MHTPVIMDDSEQLATLHCEVAVKLMGRKFVEDWLAALPLPSLPLPSLPASAPKVKGPRGRKPGAAADTERCVWISPTGQCKNKFSEGSTYCKMHEKKAVLIVSESVTDADADAVADAVSETAESSH